MKKIITKLLAAKNNKQAFTLAELMISVTILAILITIASSVYVNFFGSVRNLKAANMVYEETRFVMERITKEIRNGTIDYEEYYNQNVFRQQSPDAYDLRFNQTYAQNYCSYSLQFYDPGPDGEIGTVDDESTGMLAENSLSALHEPVQKDLFLININGNKRTYIKRIEKEVNGQKIGKIGLLKMTGYDYGVDNINSEDGGPGCEPDAGENDGRIDTWLCDDGFPCLKQEVMAGSCTGEIDIIVYDPDNPDNNSFVDITPASLDITDIKFIIAPEDDPRKAYNNDLVQIQPHVTIKISARANPALTAQFKTDHSPGIILQSTVSARAYNEIITECNLKQCFPGSTMPCPKSAGVCAGLTQECREDFLWSGCAEKDYLDYSASYESGSEIASCIAESEECTTVCSGDTDCISACDIAASICKNKKCTDGRDNDCNGLTDEADPACRYFLCHDGVHQDNVEGDKCPSPDVGGLCSIYRPIQELGETSCRDGYDNDCDGLADEFDPDCIKQFCSNGQKDIDFVNFIGYSTPSYLVGVESYDSDLNEIAPDVGGICEAYVNDEGKICGYGESDGSDGCSPLIEKSISVKEEDTLTLCKDGYDNDGDGNADEFDDNCKALICTNKQRDCGLAPLNYTPTNYLVDYNLIADRTCQWDYVIKTFPNDRREEACVDVGGYCQGFTVNGIDHSLEVDSKFASCGGNEDCIITKCTDGLDNDCNGDIDWDDTACKDLCVDADDDEFYGITNICRPISQGGIVPDYIEYDLFFDCDDEDININPKAKERCDLMDADYNCDLVPSQEDPDCCIDKDGDGYGIPTHYVSCPNNSQPDCNDNNPNINPGASELITNLISIFDQSIYYRCPNYIDSSECNRCFNQNEEYASPIPINDDCLLSGDVPRANHIDWYRDKDIAWFNWYASSEGFSSAGLTSGGIAGAYQLGLFANSCCNTSAIEICDDFTYGAWGSDENCNGLQGTDDHACIYKDGLRFLDNFTQSAYILNWGPTDQMTYDMSSGFFTLKLPTNSGTITSTTLSLLNIGSKCTGATPNYRAYVYPVYNAPSGTVIKFQFSDNGGTTWCGNDNCTGDYITIDELIAEPETYVEFNDPNNYQLRWRATLEGDGASNIPRLTNVTIKYECF